jgi:hypothetical protein
MKINKSKLNTIAGYVIGIAGIVLSIYLYIISIQERCPVLKFESTYTILNKDDISNAPLVIRKTNGSKLNGNLCQTRFYFWNAGNQSIKQENILEPIKINLNDSLGEILNCKINAKSRELVKPNIIVDSSKKSLTLNFSILEEDDGFSGDILFVSCKPVDFDHTGIIEGVKQINYSKPFVSKMINLHQYNQSLLKIILTVVSVIMILFSLLTIVFQKRNPNKFLV